MRKQINGLALIVEYSFKLNTYGDALFVFCNRSRNRIKILEWDGTGILDAFQAIGEGAFQMACTWGKGNYVSDRRRIDVSFERHEGRTETKKK